MATYTYTVTKPNLIFFRDRSEKARRQIAMKDDEFALFRLVERFEKMWTRAEERLEKLNELYDQYLLSGDKRRIAVSKGVRLLDVVETLIQEEKELYDKISESPGKESGEITKVFGQFLHDKGNLPFSEI